MVREFTMLGTRAVPVQVGDLRLVLEHRGLDRALRREPERTAQRRPGPVARHRAETELLRQRTRASRLELHRRLAEYGVALLSHTEGSHVACARWAELASWWGLAAARLKRLVQVRHGGRGAGEARALAGKRDVLRRPATR